jgi:long-chain fatty acid transport protein
MLVRRGIGVAGLVVFGCLCNHPAWSSGYFIDQQSVPGLGRADAGDVAAAYDPSTVFFNPAGMTELWVGADPSQTRQASSGVAIIVPTTDLKNTGSTASTPGSLGFQVPVSGPSPNPGNPTPVSSFYMVQRLPDNSHWYFGLGLTAPFGLAGRYSRNWFGRYDSREDDLLTANFGPVVAYKFSEQLSIGGGIDIQYANAKLISAIPNPLTPGGPTVATDGRFRVNGDDWSVGYNIGILYKPTQTLRVGVDYRSEMDHNLGGDAAFTGFTGALSSINGHTGASSELKLPAIISAGAVYDLNSNWSLFGDYAWYGWSVSQEATIEFSNGAPNAVRPAHFHDSYTVALGIERHLNEKLTLRGGVKFDQTPTNDAFRDTTFADADRLWLAIGATYKFSNALTTDFAFTHVLETGTSIDVTRNFFEGTPLESSASIRAHVQSFVDTVAVGLRYKF